jgi:hypothetical protein
MPRRKIKLEELSEVQETPREKSESPLKEKKEKKKRNINPETMTYIKALALYRTKSGHKGISPKKGTKEYDEVIKIMKEHKSK